VALAAALREFLARAAGALPKPEEIPIAAQGFDAWRNGFRTIQAREIWSIYGAWMQANKPALGPGIRERMAYAATISAEDATAARQILAAARADIRARIEPGTIACLPTAPCIAPLLDASPPELESFRSRAMALTCIAGISGLPQVSIPVGTLNGCPIGLSFIGWEGADEVLLDLAVALALYCGASARD
jgi:amidase